ncbi:MAG: hypothetical protein ACRDO0_19735 [Nocardioidaceae bacterium]
MRERAPRAARARSGRVPWTLLTVLAGIVLATLGLFGTSYSATASAGDEAETHSIAAPLLSTSAAASTATASPAGLERPDPVTGDSAPVTSTDADPNPASGSDLDPSPDAKAMVALALLVLVLCAAGGRRRAADDAPSGAYLGGVEHVPRADDPMGQLCPDAPAPAAPATVRRARRVSSGVEAGCCGSQFSTVRPSSRAVFSRVRAQVGDEAGGRATTNADRETACAGASPDDLPRAVSRSRSPVTFCRGRQAGMGALQAVGAAAT